MCTVELWTTPPKTNQPKVTKSQQCIATGLSLKLRSVQMLNGRSINDGHNCASRGPRRSLAEQMESLAKSLIKAPELCDVEHKHRMDVNEHVGSKQVKEETRSGGR